MSATPKFVWYDVMTTDLQAAEVFYRKAIGWETKDSGMPGHAYTLLSAGPTMVGGMMPIPEEAARNGARPAWSGYIAVDDVDAYADKVKAAGGAIHRPPTDIPEVGRFAVAADPQGAVFFLFKPTAPRAPRPFRRGRQAISAGTSCTPATASKPSASMRSCSAGRRPRPSIWARWVCTSCSRRAARRSAA